MSPKMRDARKSGSPFGIPARQQGVILVVAMIFLIAITILAVSAIRVININSRIVGNVQMQLEAEAAAQQAIETVIGSNFMDAPKASTHSIDINNSGKPGFIYTVNVPAPVCIGVKPIKLSELDMNNKHDIPCSTSLNAQNAGIVGGSPTGNSLCSNSLWNISASASMPNSAHQLTNTHQGIAMRVAIGSACGPS